MQEKIQDIILACLMGERDPKEENKFQLWLNENPQHRKKYEEFCSIWYAIRWGDKRKFIDREKAWYQLVKIHQKRRRIRLFAVVSIAASVILIIGMFCLFQLSTEVIPMAESETIWEKAEVTLILSSGDSIRVKQTGTSEIQESGSIIHTDSVGLHYQKNEVRKTNELIYNELIVPKSGEFRLRLADGSQVILNADSKLRYPVDFAENCRKVYLEGEACFEITKDSLRPFIVHTTHAEVYVLGTLFNLSSYDKENHTAVTLIDGKVQVCANEHKIQLKPDEQLVLDHETNDVEIRRVIAVNYIAWTKGLFRFDAIPLGQLMMKLERWYDVSYEFRDETLKNIHLTGGFWKYDDIHLIIKILEKITNVTFTIEDDKVIIDKK